MKVVGEEVVRPKFLLELQKRITRIIHFRYLHESFYVSSLSNFFVNLPQLSIFLIGFEPFLNLPKNESSGSEEHPLPCYALIVS